MIGAIIAKSAVRRAFSHFNDRNLDAFMAAWAPDAVFHYPGNAVASGVFSGKPTVRAWFARMMEQFTSINFTLRSICVQNIFDLTGSNVVSVEWDLEIRRADGKLYQNTGVSQISLRRGKATRVTDYIFDLDKVEDAWSVAKPLA